MNILFLVPYTPTPIRTRPYNLRREGIPDARIRVTGNTVVDALLWAAGQPCPPQVQRLLNRAEETQDPHSAIQYHHPSPSLDRISRTVYNCVVQQTGWEVSYGRQDHPRQ